MDKFTISLTESQVKILAWSIKEKLEEDFEKYPCIAVLEWACDLYEIYRKLDVIRKGLKEGVKE